MYTRINTVSNFAKLIVLFAATIICLTSCDEWTDVKSKFEPDILNPGFDKDETYYENLRAFKATMFDRKLSWVWFGGWTGEGAYMLNSLSGLPDSLDIVSIWGDWSFMTEARKKDLEYVQKVKGTKVLACSLIGDLGAGFTPDGEDFAEYWGWEGELRPSNKNEVPTEAQEIIIRRYARETAERIISNGLDGYDIDYEIGFGSKGTLVEYHERFYVYVDELSKYFGPKSGTDRLLVVDGAIVNVPRKTALYFDLYVIQAYRARSFSALNNGTNRFVSTVERFKDLMTVEEQARKTVMTEEFEKGQHLTGGVDFRLPSGEIVNSLKGMALWNPSYGGIDYERSGGAGVYHVEYEYEVNATNGYLGFYPWMREAIQTMNPAKVEK